jgi:putative phage-type endonuclease
MNAKSQQTGPVGSGTQPGRPWGIGGSDIGAILGLSPYRSPVEVWAEKVGTAQCAGEAVHLRYGQHLEPFVAREYERATGLVTHVHAGTIRHPLHPHLFAHVDRLVSRDGQGVLDAQGNVCATTLLECKTASAFSAAQWGRAGTDHVPHAYLVQCVWYTALTGCTEAHLAVLLGNSDLRVYRIGHDPALGERLVKSALDFWDDHVMAGVPPAPTTRDDVLALYPRETPGRVVEADPTTLSQLRRLQRIQGLTKRLDAESQRVKDQLAIRMGPAERVCHNGQTLATWRAGSPTSRVDVTRLRKERPEVVSEYLVESPAQRRLLLGGAQNA